MAQSLLLLGSAGSDKAVFDLRMDERGIVKAPEQAVRYGTRIAHPEQLDCTRWGERRIAWLLSHNCPSATGDSPRRRASGLYSQCAWPPAAYDRPADFRQSDPAVSGRMWSKGSAGTGSRLALRPCFDDPAEPLTVTIATFMPTRRDMQATEIVSIYAGTGESSFTPNRL